LLRTRICATLGSILSSTDFVDVANAVTAAVVKPATCTRNRTVT